MQDTLIWAEKYRPQTINECVTTDFIKDTFTEFVKNGSFPHLLLSGTAGTGKTTIAKALCNELNVDYLMINASEKGNIDVLRNDIKNFASTVSIKNPDKFKVIILDEADYLQQQTTQPALRGVMEEFADNCKFILTCNYDRRIIPPVKSRCTLITFGEGSKEERLRMATEFYKRVSVILEKESVTYEKQTLADVVKTRFPDFRKTLNDLQFFSSTGTLSDKIISPTQLDTFNDIIFLLKEQDFKGLISWVKTHETMSVDLFYSTFYDLISEYMTEDSLPLLILHLAKYQFQDATVSDRQLNLTACLTEIMADCEFK